MDEMKKQESFMRILETVLKSAQKNHNTITEKQLNKAFEGLDLTDEQMRTVRDYLSSNNIGVDEPLSEEEVLTPEEHDYLKDYEQMVSAIVRPDEDYLDAVKINAMAGDRNAQQELAEYLLPEVVDIARTYMGQGVYMEDLIGAGNEELIRSVRLLGPLEKAGEVELYVGKRIMDAMEDLISENLDQKARETDAATLANKVKEKAEELADALGRKITVEELAAEGEVTEDEIMDAIRVTANKIEVIDYQA